MLETKIVIEAAKTGARELDQMLVEGRKPIVGRNLEQIEGRARSEKYVGRLAGQSDDVYRKSVSERAVEWYGSAVLEDASLSGLVAEFWRPLLNHSAALPVLYRRRDFFEVDEDVNVLLSRLRRSYVQANRLECRALAVQIIERMKEVCSILSVENGVTV